MTDAMDAFRRWGFLQARLDPLGRLVPLAHPDLDVEGPEADRGRAVYCGSIGLEFMHIPHPERCRWLQERMEASAPKYDPAWIFERLARADIFERTVQGRYVGTKRYSLEGSCAAIPLLDEILEAAADLGVERAILGMSHRGRLNVMVHIVRKSATEIFVGFEDPDPRSVLGGGDVKYHLGATGEYVTRSGRRLHVHLASNASHLEAVTPVALGRARARQDRIGKGGREKVLPISLHGDAAFAGQGILAETLNLADLPGFAVGGTVHVIVNNLIGFTTPPAALHSSRYASDVARRLAIPVFHVNGEDPEAVLRVGRMAVEYRAAFASDVVVDLIGYRRHGHSEVEDPTTTQPALYERIARRPPEWRTYATAAKLDDAFVSRRVDELVREYRESQDHAAGAKTRPVLFELPGYWSEYSGGRYDASREVDTAVPAERLARLAEGIAAVPAGFSAHPKVATLMEQRRKMGRGELPLDWATAEALALASLLAEGTPVRLTGEDVRRGTFNQRHAVLVDRTTEAEYFPLAHVDPAQGRFQCYDSPLSEASVLGFEYGYSRDYPEALVMWEAQFGDFANGAQVIVDQFLSSGEDKWGLLSGLVLLLPHGYEGQGAEHSSARLERFLQLAAEDNWQICQPSTAAQYFHVLRRQARRRWRKPLVVLTPKGMLRHPRAASPAAELAQGRFRPVAGDTEPMDARRILVCTGKIGHELQERRARQGGAPAAIILLDQLYPFPEVDLGAAFEKHRGAREIVWVQEEPANMGALSFVLPRLHELAGGRPVRTVKRSATASPATGSAKAHQLEQAAILALAFGPREG